MAAASRIERSVGEVIEVPGTTEAELRADILAQITAICEPKLPIREDEVTIDQMAKQWGYSRSTAANALDQQVDEGKLTKRKTLSPDTGRECWAYRVCNASKNP